MAKTLEMVFRDQIGGTATIHLPDPKNGLTLAEVKTVMQEIVDRNVFQVKGGKLAQVVEARIHNNDLTVLN